MITGKQRGYLRGLANSIDPIFQIGKHGITENFVKQINDALEARELIKIKVLKNSILDAKEAANDLSEMTNSDIVQIIGNKFVLYRESEENKRIELP
jgi:RNA-binding protein